MVYPFPSRARLKASGSPKRGRLMLTSSSSRDRTSANALPDIFWTSMRALKESADAFPPLKGAVGGAIALCEIAERAKHSKSDARAIALRVKEIIDGIADAVPDGSVISPPMLISIQRFTILLDEIRSSMEDIALTNRASRILHLNRDERLLQSIKNPA
ncbi:hypothetical protein MVEN_00265300 [Mycena venus]|uniref:Uncharacterized protein n=1 Tax=Mycena venus TaxID=2733690 RepID=A0A8H6Z2B3_9AGAR|nr:hypothetical protein MVEN_00265300 [Mycena venus]